jgi:hypothetical protein
MEELERPDIDRVREAMAEHDQRQDEPSEEDERKEVPEREDEDGEGDGGDG